MTSVVVLSHGGLAKELLAAARTIVGTTPPWMQAVCLDWEASFEEARQQAARTIATMGPTEGLLILTDMYGTTPFNVATSFADSDDIQVLAGVNLPMVLRLCCLGQTEMNTRELVLWLEEKGRRSICHCDDGHRTSKGTMVVAGAARGRG